MLYKAAYEAEGNHSYTALNKTERECINKTFKTVKPQTPSLNAFVAAPRSVRHHTVPLGLDRRLQFDDDVEAEMARMEAELMSEMSAKTHPTATKKGQSKSALADTTVKKVEGESLQVQYTM